VALIILKTALRNQRLCYSAEFVVRGPVDIVRTMAGFLTACSTCKKSNKAGGRYCIYCGSILKPVYCSSCGKANPDELTQCLECGNPIPKLTGIRWGPIVNVLQPTSAMISPIPETPQGEQFEEEVQEVDDRQKASLSSKLKSRFSRTRSQDD
jgi:hypothetical protein